MADIRTDLAEEAHSFYIKRNNLNKTDGVTARTEKGSVYSVTRVRIETPDAAKRLQKPVGSYVTLHSEHLKTGLYTQELSEAVACEIKKLLPKEKKDPLILVAGLGNKRATPDALGPRVTDQVIITRHMPESDAFSNVCALSPGVLGITGIETAEIFSSVAKDVRPDLVIAVDALASGNAENLGTTVQLSDTGINPGSGVHNRRNALNSETLGAPVIALGVPTVCDSSSLLRSAFLSSPDIDEEDSEALISHLFSSGETMMVTPKNIDAVIERSSIVLSRAINLALHPSLSYAQITEFTS